MYILQSGDFRCLDHVAGLGVYLSARWLAATSTQQGLLCYVNISQLQSPEKKKRSFLKF